MSEIRTFNGQKVESIQLQGVGWCPAIKATQLKVGDYRVYNYGGLCKIVSIEEVSKCYLSITVESKEGMAFGDTGTLYTSKIKKSTLVVIADEKGKFQYRKPALAR